MKKTLLSLALCLFAGATFAQDPVGLAAGTYKVGGDGADYATLSAAAAAINAAPITGNVVLHICSDITEADKFGLVNPTDFSITIRPDKAEARTITFASTVKDPNNAPSGSIVLGIKTEVLTADVAGGTVTTETKNVTIDGAAEGSDVRNLTFNFKAAAGSRICVYGKSSNIAIKNLTIQGRENGSSQGVQIRQHGSTVAPDGVLIENCHINCIGGTSQAINFSCVTAAQATNVVIRDCEILARNRGIFMDGANSIVVEGCTFSIEGKAGVVCGGVIINNYCSGSHIFRGNKFVKCSTVNTNKGNYGLRGITAGGGDWLIENNYFAGMDVTAVADAGATEAMYIRCGAGTHTIRHNTFYMPKLTKEPATELMSANPIACLYLAGGTNTIENNIFVSDEIVAYNSLVRGTLPATAKNNVFYHAGGNAAIVAGAPTAQDWTTYGEKYATNSPAAWVDVEFTDAANGDLSLTGASDGDAKLAVPAIAEVTKDINGTARNTDKVYAGAYEGSDFKDSPETALENVEQQVEVRKVIENGQLIIIRDGVRYNALGIKLQ